MLLRIQYNIPAWNTESTRSLSLDNQLQSENVEILVVFSSKGNTIWLQTIAIQWEIKLQGDWFTSYLHLPLGYLKRCPLG